MEPTSAARHERLERTLRERVVPALAPGRAHRTNRDGAALAPPSPLAPRFQEAEVEALVRLLRQAEDGAAAHYVRTLHGAGAPLDRLYLELLAPAARRLGALWESDESDFVEVTVGLDRLQRLLRELSRLFLAPSPASNATGTVLLTCVPGEQHTLGLVMVGEFLLRDGWRVIVGTPWTDDDLVGMVRAEWCDIIGYSVGSAQRLPALRRDIRRLIGASRNPQVQFMVGGPLFATQPSLVTDVGAHAHAADARQAPAVARALLAASRAVPPAQAPREVLGGHGQLSESGARA